MKRTMLIPTDFDEAAPHLMDFCAGTRERGIVKCILVHVLDTSGMEGPVISRSMDDAHQKLNILAEPMRMVGIEVVVCVETGNVTHQILRIAQQQNVDVIVMATTAKSRLQRLFTGSLSEDVAFSQKAPTLLVRDDLIADCHDAETLSLQWSQKLVVPIDFSASSARAVLQCTRFDPEAIGEVRLVHVLDKNMDDSDVEAAVAENRFRLSAFCGMLEDLGIKAVPVVRKGEVIDEVMAEVEESCATGIVIGTNSRTRISEMLLGSNAQSVIAASPVLVMVVP